MAKKSGSGILAAVGKQAASKKMADKMEAKKAKLAAVKEKPKKAKGKEKHPPIEAKDITTVSGILKETIEEIENNEVEKKAFSDRNKELKRKLKENGYPTGDVNLLLRRRRLETEVRLNSDMNLRAMEQEMAMPVIQLELQLDDPTLRNVTTDNGAVTRTPVDVAKKLKGDIGGGIIKGPEQNPAFPVEDKIEAAAVH